MKKRFLSILAVLAILLAPTVMIADEVEIDFGTDSYDEDGCFF